MSISRFQQSSGSFDLSVFFDWLNANKAGTFLNNFTLTNSKRINNNDTIDIVGPNSSVKIISRSGSAEAVFQFDSGTFSFVARTANASSSCSTYITGALLCSKGIIIQLYGLYASNSYNNSYGVCITVDNNGELAIISTTNSIPTSTTEIITWTACAAGSTANAQRDCRPFFQANLTSLAPITAQGNDAELSLPYAYAAIATQLNQEGLYPVAINGDNYITNGVWYIKDGA